MRIASLFDCELVLNVWFALLLLGLAVSGRAAEVLLLFGALITHELAHLAVGYGFGIKFRRIELLPYGGVAQTDNLYAADPAAVALTALAGPVNNLLLFGCIHLLAGAGWIKPPLADFGLKVNLTLALFNLIPALPLDGGRIVHAVIRRNQGELKALSMLTRWGYVVAAAMIVATLIAAGFAIALPTLPVLAFFVAIGAGRERQAAAVGHLRPLWQRPLQLERTGVLPGAVLVTGGETTVRTILSQMAGARYHWVCLVDQSLRPYGRLSEADIVAAALQGQLNASLDELLNRR